MSDQPLAVQNAELKQACDALARENKALLVQIAQLKRDAAVTRQQQAAIAQQMQADTRQIDRLRLLCAKMTELTMTELAKLR
jgi:hypothetical protein